MNPNDSILNVLRNLHAGFVSFVAVTTPKFAGGKKTIAELTNGESFEIFRLVFARGIVGAAWENVVQNAAKREGTENESKYILDSSPIRWIGGALAKHFSQEKFYLRLVHPKVFRERYFYRKENGEIVSIPNAVAKAHLYVPPVSEKVSDYVGSEKVPQFRNYSLENVRAINAGGMRFRA